MTESNLTPQEQLTKLINNSFPNPIDRQIVIGILKKYRELFLINEQMNKGSD